MLRTSTVKEHRFLYGLLSVASSCTGAHFSHRMLQSESSTETHRRIQNELSSAALCMHNVSRPEEIQTQRGCFHWALNSATFERLKSFKRNDNVFGMHSKTASASIRFESP